MKNIILYIAVSLDGRIAEPDDGTECDGAGKNIWLFGGGVLTSMLLSADLVDEMQICYIPVILGNGIPLFPKQPTESKWKLNESRVYDSGILKVDYLLDNRVK